MGGMSQKGPDLRSVTTTSGALLGLLSFGEELTGYQLRARAQDGTRFFWAAPAMSQVYVALEQLRGDGLVLARQRRQGQRVSTAYRITPTGIQALRRWLARLAEEEPMLRHPLALRVFLGHLSDPATLLKAVTDQQRRSVALLEHLSQIRAGLAGRQELAYAELVTEWGEQYLAGEILGLAQLARRLTGLPKIMDT